MIEMRWIEREEVVSTLARLGMPPKEIKQTTRILQYRWSKALIGIHTGSWSAWQDVPTVKE
jgi:hypothetical protein